MGFAGVPDAAADDLRVNDTITLTDTGLAANEPALQPKKLVTITGGHFHPYLDQFEKSTKSVGSARLRA
jgi:hypothetical protein